MHNFLTLLVKIGNMCPTLLSCISWVRLSATLWTITHQAPLLMGILPRQEYWSELPSPPPGDLLNPGIKSWSPTLQTDSLPSDPQGSPRILGWVAYSFSRDLPDPGIEPSNWGLLHCRRILCQLSYQGTHLPLIKSFKPD